MKNLIAAILCLFPAFLFAQKTPFGFEKGARFFPESKARELQNIDWGYLTVPENWTKPGGRTIKLAVAVLKGISKQASSNAVVYIPGGPGGEAIRGIETWLNHPLRKESDIILVDIRGTGFSQPQFCPDLGKKFLEILAKNQTGIKDEQEKVIAAAACKQDLINRGIDIGAYTSTSIAKDLNALKKVLQYNKWNVYGVSYGTYVTQVYANDFPDDVKSLILDSPISDISRYYSSNTDNYMSSLGKVFDACKNDPDCNKQYPDLEKTYYATIEKLDKIPITVNVNKEIISSGKFTYNAEDFKIAIQQALYNKKLIEVIPLLITAFNKENTNTLSTLVNAFSRSLNLDYGAYYCVTCNEVIPYNSIALFDENASKYKELKGGLSFYGSDFDVCTRWNSLSAKQSAPLANLSGLKVPVMVFSGGFDPITPTANGKATVAKFENGFLVEAPTFGHAPGFSAIGSEMVSKFITNPDQRMSVTETKFNHTLNFATGITINKGVSGLAASLNEHNVLFFTPLTIALGILLTSVFTFIYQLVKKRSNSYPDKILCSLIIITSLLGLFAVTGFILAITNTAHSNFFILAFGLPGQYNYLFLLNWIFIGCTFVSLVYFIFKIKVISNASIISTVLFSFLLVSTYFKYWGLV
jgi:pimeloyl-ACP methyl ester carboxylesterase